MLWDDITYSMILSACSRGGAWELAVHLFDSASSQGFDAHEHVVSAAVTACGRSSHWQQALLIADAGELADDVAVLSASIDACRRAGYWEAAMVVFDRLQRLGQTTAAGSGAAVSALAFASHWIEALQLFEVEFQQAKALNPGIRGYEAALQACAQGNNWQIALSLLEEIEHRQLSRDKRSFNTALTAYRRAMKTKKRLRVLLG
eukprot:symbB.v1.2.022255.t1/scaffold1966.1/size94513/5